MTQSRSSRALMPSATGIAAALLGLAAAACGGAGEPAPRPSAASGQPAERPGSGSVAAAEPSAWAEGVALPELGTVGLLPPAGRRITIRIDAAGALSVGGAPADADGLREALRAAAGEPHGAGAADVDALLVLDRSLPWRVAQLCMQECAATRVARLFFAARHVSGGEPGALAAFLPEDIGVMSAARIEVPRIAVRVRAEGAPSDAYGLFPVLAAYAAEHSTSPSVELDAAGSTPVGFVLALVDAAALAGASAVTFVGAPGRIADGGFPADVAALAGAAPALHAEALGAPLPAPPAEMEAVARVRAGYAGFPVSRREVNPVEEEIELVEPDER